MEENIKTLFAGPFVGEFGFELFGWQSYIRKMSRDFDKTVICSRPENEYLYRDFCDEFIGFDPGSYNCSGWDCYSKSHTGDVHDLKNPERYKYNGNLSERYNPSKIVFTDNLRAGLNLIKKPQEFFKYGDDKFESNIDFLIHARKIESGPQTKVSRNWPLVSWEKLISKLLNEGYKIASIGLDGFAWHINGTENFLNKDLEYIANHLRKAKSIIGPSSGPIHFATLCGCPQVTWGEAHLITKYEKEWNPFCTPVCYYRDNSWKPDPDKIFGKIISFLGEEK